MNFYELLPVQEQNQKSFYGKAIVQCYDKEKILFSYGTKIASIKGNKIKKYWSGWSKTTGKHIFAFCGLKKADFQKLKLEV